MYRRRGRGGGLRKRKYYLKKAIKNIILLASAALSVISILFTLDQRHIPLLRILEFHDSELEELVSHPKRLGRDAVIASYEPFFL
jgi:hypothetical protein